MAFKLPVEDKLHIPLLGFGSGTTHFNANYVKGVESPVNTKLVSLLTTSIQKGFTHLDSAEVYGNDAELKESLHNGLKEGFQREDIFITDKYFAGDGTYTLHSKYDNPYDRIKKLASYLETPYVDLYLIHAPFIKKESHGFDLKEAWAYMQQAYDEGLAKRIGVSNFAVEDLEKIWNTSKTNPQVNQIEFNAFLQNQSPGIVHYCQSKGILIEAYSPLNPITSADLTTNAGSLFAEYLDSLCEKYSKTRLQVLLRWVIQLGIIPITTTSKTERFTEFEGIFGWELAKPEVERITSLGNAYQPPFRKYWKPEYGKFDV